MASDYRSARRSVSSTFRMTAEDKVRLKREAEVAGYTLQQLFEAKMLGQAQPVGRSGPQTQSERLDLTA